MLKKSSKTLMLFFCVAVFSACTQDPSNVVLLNKSGSYSNSQNPFKIKVKQGDTVYKIARQYDVGTREIIELNRLSPPYFLNEGQSLKLPKAKFHTVSKGDTIYAISRSYNVDISRLVRINNIEDPYIIKPKQVLKLPSSMAFSGYNLAESSSGNIEIAEAEVKPDPTTKKLRNVMERDLGLLDKPSKKPIILPKKVSDKFTVVAPEPIVKKSNIASGAPVPSLKSGGGLAPTLKPGSNYASAKSFSKKYQKTSYKPYVDKPKPKKTLFFGKV